MLKVSRHFTIRKTPGTESYKLQYDFQKLQPCMDKLATPFSTRFYIHGLNTHKDTNNSQIKINIKIVSSDCHKTVLSRSYGFLLWWEESWTPERRKFIVPIKSLTFVQPCGARRGEPRLLLELWCAVAGGREAVGALLETAEGLYLSVPAVAPALLPMPR